MYRTDRIRIGERHELFAYLDDFAHKAKCLHNASLFRIRNSEWSENILCAWLWCIAEADESYIKSGFLFRSSNADSTAYYQTVLF